MNIFKLCAAILQDFGHPKNRCWHTQLNVCEKEGFPCFLYLIQIFEGDLLHELTGFYGLKTYGDLTEILGKGKYKIIDRFACVIKGTGTACLDTKKRRKIAGSPDCKFILLKTIDVFRPSEGIYLLSNTAVTQGKWSEKMEKLLGNEIREDEDYTILLLCGTHGRPNGKSGYSVRYCGNRF